jgi:hypothetical protein
MKYEDSQAPGHFWNRCKHRYHGDLRRARCEGKKNHGGYHFAEWGFWDLEWDDEGKQHIVTYYPLSWVLDEFVPGSHDGFTWEDEEKDLLSAPCVCNAQPDEHGVYNFTPSMYSCGTPGHYQLMLEEHIKNNGIPSAVLLGKDGRVWDGHHRITAARRLGFEYIPVEFA